MKLGYSYRDGITGFEGVCTAHCKYLVGNDRVQLQPVCIDGAVLRKSEWFEIATLQPLPNGPIRAMAETDPT